jgi:GntR family transcriptional regulator, arabinose operon transcriptional repressor
MKKYEIIIDWVKTRIESGELSEGDKLPSESEFIKQFGFSRNVIRQAANELNRQNIIESRRGVGYFVKRLISNESRDVAFICFRSSSYIFPDILHGANKVIQKNGFHMIFHESWYDINVEKEILNNLLNKQVRGIIMTPVQGVNGDSNVELVETLESQGVPVVLLDSFYPNHQFSSVSLSDEKSGYILAEYLFENGHRDIAMIYSKNYYPKILRCQGVKRLYREKGFPIEDSRFYGIEGQISVRKVYRQIDNVLEKFKKMPSAIICSSDDEANILLHQLKRRGVKVPRDTSVVSFDNSDLSRHAHPPITTMNHPSEYMGEMVAEMMMGRIKSPGMKIKSHTYIDSNIILRESVKDISES